MLLTYPPVLFFFNWVQKSISARDKKFHCRPKSMLKCALLYLYQSIIYSLFNFLSCFKQCVSNFFIINICIKQPENENGIYKWGVINFCWNSPSCLVQSKGGKIHVRRLVENWNLYKTTALYHTSCNFVWFNCIKKTVKKGL